MGAGGRPRKYKTVKELQTAIDKYFKSCILRVIVRDSNNSPIYDEDGEPVKKDLILKPITVTGLAAALGMTREGLITYQGREEFADTITRAKQRCQQFAEEQLYLAKNATGAIFSLKNNWEWKDKTEQEVTVKGGFAVRLQQARERRKAKEQQGTEPQ